MEASLGASLFLRERRAIRLTSEGETLMRHVERGFGELRLGLASVEARGPQLLRLHSAPSFAAQWLVPRLRRLLEEAGGLEVRIAAGTDYTRFLGDEFDVDIIYGEPNSAFYGQQGLVALPLGTETITPMCAPGLAAAITSAAALREQVLIESAIKKVRWPAWFAANGVIAPEPHGPRFDRSFLSLRAAMDGLGVALESTRLAERELAEGSLVRPLAGICEDVAYTAHWLVFPQAKRYSRSVVLFTEWLARNLNLELDFKRLDDR